MRNLADPIRERVVIPNDVRNGGHLFCRHMSDPNLAAGEALPHACSILGWNLVGREIP